MAYDSNRQRVQRLLYIKPYSNGGAVTVILSEWDGIRWTDVATPGIQFPSDLRSLVYDSARRGLLFSGSTSSRLYEFWYQPIANRAPRITAIPAQIVFAHDTLALAAQASDPDQNPLILSASGLPPGAALTPDGAF